MQPDLIIDVGVHRGEDSAFYLSKGYRVVGVEANPDLYATLTERFSEPIERGRMRLLNCAVAPQDGPTTFYRNNAVSDWGTTSAEWVKRNERLGTPSVAETVLGRRFGAILDEVGIPYYLKIDIEGADLLCVEALKRFRDRPKYLSLESTMTSWSDLRHEFELLQELGYTRFKVVNQLQVPQQTCPYPAREGRYVPQAFSEGASGAFGDEAPGPWMSAGAAVRLYRRIFLHYWIFGNDSALASLDWSSPLLWRFQRYMVKRRWADTHAAL